MSYCTHCGAPLQGTEAFCTACGARLSAQRPDAGSAPVSRLTPEPPEMSEPELSAPARESVYTQPAAPGREPSYAQPAVQAQAHARTETPPPPRQESPYAPTGTVKAPGRVLGTWGYVLSIVLMSLPLVGLVLQIVWACGGTGSLNRRNLARACLILTLVGVALGALIFIAVFALLLPELETIFKTLFYEYGPNTFYRFAF